MEPENSTSYLPAIMLQFSQSVVKKPSLTSRKSFYDVMPALPQRSWGKTAEAINWTKQQDKPLCAAEDASSSSPSFSALNDMQLRDVKKNTPHESNHTGHLAVYQIYAPITNGYNLRGEKIPVFLYSHSSKRKWNMTCNPIIKHKITYCKRIWWCCWLPVTV